MQDYRLEAYPTDTAEWVNLVIEAQDKKHIYFNEEVESYLVFLLIRYSTRPEILSKIVGLELLQQTRLSKTAAQEKLQEIGDVCLIFSGFYPELHKKRNVSSNYYMEVGSGAFALLSGNNFRNDGATYYHLSKEFVPITSVLASMRGLNNPPILVS